MTLQIAIETLRQVGPVTIEGGMICCDVPDPTPAEVDRALDVLRERKPEALVLLGWRSGTAAEPRWSPECLAAERKFRIPAAKLYPLLDHLVLTPEGAGILLQVFSDRVAVHFKGERRTREFRPEQIAVPDDARQAREARSC